VRREIVAFGDVSLFTKFAPTDAFSDEPSSDEA